MNIEGPTNIRASSPSLESFGAKLIILFMPEKSRNINVEPKGIAIRTRIFLVTCSVSSLNKIA